MNNSDIPVNNSAEGLRRGMNLRQLSMMAMGGAIGVGLFLGSSVTIQLAGPGVIVTYLFAAVVALIVAYALAEMAVVHPVAGSFGIYAERYLNPWAGFTVRATYGVIQIIAIGAEVTAVGIYFGFWFPGVPQWAWVSGASVLLVTINTLQVRRFGEFEYYFALIKVLAILAFIGVGTALLTGLGPTPAAGLSNLTGHGGFLPNGWKGVWLATTLAITSYMGVEIIAVTAGEAQDPEKTIPRAMKTIVYRLIIFYVAAIAVMLAITPWNQTGGDITASPFVRAFSAAGIPYAASIMNLVVITAALSSSNADLYLSTRMIFSLARGGYAPARLGRVSEEGVPLGALATATTGMIVAIVLAIYVPEKSFLLLYGVAVAGMFFVWLVILFSHLSFRRAIGTARAAELPLRLPLHPIPTVFGIVALLAIAATTLFVDGLRYSLPLFVPFLLLISLAYWKLQKNRSEVSSKK